MNTQKAKDVSKLPYFKAGPNSYYKYTTFEERTDHSKDYTVAKQGKHKNSHLSLEKCLEDTKDFVDMFPPMVVKQLDNNITVVDEGEIGIGFKARAAQFALAQLPHKEIVYVATRQGYAPVSLAYLCNKLGKKLTLVIPACKEISEHQAAAIEMGATPRFIRVVRMPVANRMAQEYADAVGAFYFKGGLSDDNVFKGAVRVLYDNLHDKEIQNMWCVTSTGVLVRSLQTALPDTNFTSIAVSRSIKKDDVGRARCKPYHKHFLQQADLQPENLDTVKCYDAKGLEYLFLSQEKAWFFNVAGEMAPTTINKAGFDSWIDWNDISQFPEVQEVRNSLPIEQFKLF